MARTTSNKQAKNLARYIEVSPATIKVEADCYHCGYKSKREIPVVTGQDPVKYVALLLRREGWREIDSPTYYQAIFLACPGCCEQEDWS